MEPESASEEKKEVNTDPNGNLTLLEEILLLDLKGNDGSASFWSYSMSPGLRGCILIELALRNRIQLDTDGALLNRKVILKSGQPTGDDILDEAFEHIKDKALQTVPSWVDSFSGRGSFWQRCPLKAVRARVTENLVKKNVLHTDVQNYTLFNWTTHPINQEGQIVEEITERIQYWLLKGWPKEIHACSTVYGQRNRRDPTCLNFPHRRRLQLALARVGSLHELHFALECAKGDSSFPVLFAVFKAFTGNVLVTTPTSVLFMISSIQNAL